MHDNLASQFDEVLGRFTTPYGIHVPEDTSTANVGGLVVPTLRVSARMFDDPDAHPEDGGLQISAMDDKGADYGLDIYRNKGTNGAMAEVGLPSGWPERFEDPSDAVKRFAEVYGNRERNPNVYHDEEDAWDPSMLHGMVWTPPTSKYGLGSIPGQKVYSVDRRKGTATPYERPPIEWDF